MEVNKMVNHYIYGWFSTDMPKQFGGERNFQQMMLEQLDIFMLSKLNLIY